MAHFDRMSHAPDLDDTPESAKRRARHGMGLFLIYLALYTTFVGLNAFEPLTMETMAIAGLNLAIVYGFVLIGAALALALVYAWLCRNPGQRSSADERTRAGS